MTWQDVGDIASAVAAGAAVLGILLLVWQLRGIRHAQDVTIALSLLERRSSDEFRAAVSWVRSPEADRLSHLTPEEFERQVEMREHCELLWSYYEFVGVLVRRKALSEDILFDQGGILLSDTWERTHRYIHARRDNTTRYGARYMENFQFLKERWARWDTRQPPRYA
ncbi:MAG: hypothetical protein AB7I38_12825 [Dehalococcoidia bacterium]